MPSPLALACVAVAAAGVTLLAGCTSSAAPAASAAGVAEVTVTLSSKGCLVTPSTIPAGPATFRVSNTDSGSLNEAELVDGPRILAEKENLTPGLRGSFSYSLTTGTYTLQCLGDSKKKQGAVRFHVTAGASPAAS